MTITTEDMRGNLLTMDQVREQLAQSEPLTQVTFSTGESPSAEFRQGWHKTELTEPAQVWLRVPNGERYQLTHQAAQQLASECHINRGYQEMIPATLLQENVNWWLSTGLGDRELKLLCAGTGEDLNGNEVPLAVAQTRATITPFSNLRLVDTIISRIEAKYGQGEVLADYKRWHDLEHTVFRFIVPAERRVISGTGEDDDAWSVGVQFKNSLIGLRQTFIDGYLFRWVCTNGEIDVAHSSGGFARRGSSPDDVYEWAREAVDEVLEGMPVSLDNVQALTSQEIPEREGAVRAVLTDLFSQYSIPVRERHRVFEAMADVGSLTMYNLMNEVTRTANLDGLPYRSVEQLMSLGGHIMHSIGGRCTSCNRLLPPDWDSVPHAHAHAPEAVLEEESEAV